MQELSAVIIGCPAINKLEKEKGRAFSAAVTAEYSPSDSDVFSDR